MEPQPFLRVAGSAGGVDPPEIREGGRSRASLEDRWRAFHLFYHQDQERLLLELVTPLVGELLAEDAIDRFYFVRYDLGGPHVRLRWRVVGDATEAEARLAAAAEEFFARTPSTESLAAGQIHKLNRSVLGSDLRSAATDDVVFPDNSWGAFPVGLEIERYGGPGRIDHSLELFTASSVRALELLRLESFSSPGKAQARFFSLLVQLGAAFAVDEAELFELAGYGARLLGAPFQLCIDEADRYFGQHRESLIALAARALDPKALEAESLAEAVRRFRVAGFDLSREWRWQIAASHIHMTANRLGLRNPDEVYLSRLAGRALRGLIELEVTAGRRPWRAPSRAQDVSGRRLAEWVEALLARLHSQSGRR